MANEKKHGEGEPSGEVGRKTGGLVALARYSHLGLVLPAGLFVGWIFGALLDKAFDTHWIYLAGMALGVVAGFWDLARAAMELGSDK